MPCRHETPLDLVLHPVRSFPRNTAGALAPLLLGPHSQSVGLRAETRRRGTTPLTCRPSPIRDKHRDDSQVARDITRSLQPLSGCYALGLSARVALFREFHPSVRSYNVRKSDLPSPSRLTPRHLTPTSHQSSLARLESPRRLLPLSRAQPGPEGPASRDRTKRHHLLLDSPYGHGQVELFPTGRI